MRTVTILDNFAFVIARHSCHRYVYLMVIVIFAVVACTITFLIKAYLLSPFLIIFWWLGTYCNHVIFRSTSKAFLRRTFRISVRWNIIRASFLYSFLILLYFFSAEWLLPPQNVNFSWTECALSLCLIEPELLLSRFR